MNAPLDRTNPHLPPAGPTPAASPSAPEAPPDVVGMVRRALAHWHAVIVTMLLGALITGQVVRVRKPLFKSETVIFYREGIGKSITGPIEDRDSVRALGTKLKETLLAQQTLRGLIDEFHLYPDVVQKSGYADAVDRMRRKTEFKSRSADTFAISFEGVSKDEAQRVCARMAAILVAENAKRLADDNRSATDFLVSEKKRADDELERLEREASEFLAAHPEFAGSKEGLGTAVVAQQRKLQREDRKQRAAESRGSFGRRARSDRVTSATHAGAAAQAVDPVLIAARTRAADELDAARKELAERSLRFTEQHPDVRAAQAHVAAAEGAMRRAESAIAAALPADEPATPRQPASIEDPYGAGDEKIARSHKPVVSAPVAFPTPAPPPRATADEAEKVVDLEVEWTQLGRALGLARRRQADLEQKLYRAEMITSTVESGHGTTISVLDPAYKPSGPSNAPNRTVAMIGLALSIAIGLALSAAWGLFLDDRVFSASEIEGIVMVPLLATVPRENKKRSKKSKASGAPQKPRGASDA